MAFRDSRKKIDEGKEIHVWYIGCVENCFLNIAENLCSLSSVKRAMWKHKGSDRHGLEIDELIEIKTLQCF